MLSSLVRSIYKKKKIEEKNSIKPLKGKPIEIKKIIKINSKRIKSMNTHTINEMNHPISHLKKIMTFHAGVYYFYFLNV